METPESLKAQMEPGETPCQTARRINHFIDHWCMEEYLRGKAEGRKEAMEEAKKIVLIVRDDVQLRGNRDTSWRSGGIYATLEAMRLLNKIADLPLPPPPKKGKE